MIYDALPTFSDFALVTNDAIYQSVPDDWIIGLSDVVGSTKAMEGGRYKAVNMAGAALISAMINARPDTSFPFVFGGDGAAFALPGQHTDIARDVLATTAAWVRDDLDLCLRVALVPVAAPRAAGHDLKIARFQASDAVSYAMFSGGGVRWAEEEMKRGGFAVDPAAVGARPDLSGLSCRWTPIEAGDGVILSLIAAPIAESDPLAFGRFVSALLSKIHGDRDGHPVPPSGPGFTWPPKGLDYEARAARGHGSLSKSQRSLYLITFLAWILDKTGIKLGGFDPTAYRHYTTLNSDFRKYDDGLRLTVNCTEDEADRIEALCSASSDKGIISYGIHRQSAALMTCIVPSILSNAHFHFLDGASGGYAMAASHMKAGSASSVQQEELYDPAERLEIRRASLSAMRLPGEPQTLRLKA